MKRFLKSESNLERVWQVNDDDGQVSHYEIEPLNPEGVEDGTFWVANVPPEPKQKRRVFRRRSK